MHLDLYGRKYGIKHQSHFGVEFSGLDAEAPGGEVSTMSEFWKALQGARHAGYPGFHGISMAMGVPQ